MRAKGIEFVIHGISPKNKPKPAYDEKGGGMWSGFRWQRVGRERGERTLLLNTYAKQAVFILYSLSTIIIVYASLTGIFRYISPCAGSSLLDSR